MYLKQRLRRRSASPRRLAVIAFVVLLVPVTTASGAHHDEGGGRRPSIVWQDPSAVVTFRVGWSAAACSESAALVCVERNGEPVGTIEATAYPLDTFPDPDLARRHPLRFLRSLAEEAEASFRSDREATCGADYIVDATGPARRQVMGTRGVGYGFSGRFPGGPTTELVQIHLAIIDDHVVATNASAHDPQGCIGAEGVFGVADLRAFRRHLRKLVSTLPPPSFLWDDHPGGGGAPAVAIGADADTVVLDAQGAEVLRIPLLEDASLDGTVVAGIGPGGGAGIALGISTNAYDTTTGNQLWTALHTHAAIVLDEGRRVALLPDPWGQRDPQVNSIWMIEEDGTDRLVVQFANGPGLPGYDPGFEGDNALLSVSFDDDASVAVVTQGNDVDLFVYDIFAVDVATGDVTRLSTGKQSRSAAVSPDGDRVAFQRDLGSCGPDHVRAADLLLIGIDGSGERLLASGSCDEWFFNPRWIAPDEVAVYRNVGRSTGGWATDVVVFDVGSGTERALTTDGNAQFFSVDADGRRIAISSSSSGGFTLVDLDEGDPVEFEVDGATGIPRLSGDHQWP